MTDNQKKVALLCLLVITLVCLIATNGCSVSSKTEIKAEPKPVIYSHDLTYPVTGYDLDKVVTLTLEIECCEDCGFTPWTDSWCEKHFGT